MDNTARKIKLEKVTPISADQQSTMSAPKPSAGGGYSIDKLKNLVTLQANVRAVKNERELTYLITNDSRIIIDVRQIFLVRHGRNTKPRVISVSSLMQVERNAPLIRAIEKHVSHISSKSDGTNPITSTINDDVMEKNPDLRDYPFKEFLWMPMVNDKGDSFAGILFARDKAWTGNDEKICEHLAQIYSYAWTKIAGPKRSWLPKKPLVGLALLLAIAAGVMTVVKVPLTTLAPAQITARNAAVVSAPMDGIIERILVEPNSTVEKDQPIIRYDDVALRNDVELASKNVNVMAAKERQLTHSAFVDIEAQHQLAIAKVELELSQAELVYKQELLSQTTVLSDVEGVVLFDDPDEWKGRPVHTGLRILRIANPTEIQLTINLPISDAIAAEPGNKVRMYLDSSPLEPINATLERVGYEATQVSPDTLAYKLTAKLDDKAKDQGLRIGLRGTAQVYSDDVSLFFFLFRRPISALRQMIGL
ncbi:MAG: HlyD family efflux transporter periplasmic adaptor subunit [Pseudomonadota bacterium]